MPPDRSVDDLDFPRLALDWVLGEGSDPMVIFLANRRKGRSGSARAAACWRSRRFLLVVRNSQQPTSGVFPDLDTWGSPRQVACVL
jgi:hypothetical protein